MNSPADITRRSILAATGAAALSASAASAQAPSPKATGTIAKRRLGRTGVEVSMLGLGGHHIGRPKGEQDGIRLVRMAIDHGITFLDNCWDYNGGRSEERMGKALRDGYRQRAFLMTKIDGRTKDSAARQLEQSLARLQTDVIDLVQIHEVIRLDDAERCFGAGGAMEALLAAKKAGKLRFIGFTGHKDPSIHLQMLRTGLAHGFTFDTVQMPINVMDAHFRSFQKEVVPVCLEHKVGVLGMKSMGDGIILKSGVPPRDCLRYALSAPTSVVITGCESVEILQQAIDVGTHFTPLTAEEKQALLAKTAPLAKEGKFELFKTSPRFDGTARNPKWLGRAEL